MIPGPQHLPPRQTLHPSPLQAGLIAAARHQIVHPHETAGVAPLLPCQLPQHAAGSHIRGAGGIGQIGPPVRQLILDEVLNEPDAAHGPACKAAPALRRYLRGSRHRRSPRPLRNILCPRFSRWLPTGGPHLRVRVQLRRYPLPDAVAALRVHVLHLLHMQPPFFSHYSMLRREKTSLSIAFSRKLC